MKILPAVLYWSLAVLCATLLFLSLTGVGRGIFGGNGLIWSYLLVLVFAAILLVPAMRRKGVETEPPEDLR